MVGAAALALAAGDPSDILSPLEQGTKKDSLLGQLVLRKKKHFQILSKSHFFSTPFNTETRVIVRMLEINSSCY